MSVFEFEPFCPTAYQTGRLSIVCAWKGGINLLTGWTNSQVIGLDSFRKQIIITNLVYLFYSRSF